MPLLSSISKLKTTYRPAAAFNLSLLFTLTLLPLLFLPAAKATAAAYYVSPNGNDSSAGTNAAPWATFARAMTVLQPGDTLYLEDGIYNQPLEITVSGSSGMVITFSAEDDGEAIVSTTYPDSALVIGDNVSYVEVDGINFRNSGPAGSGITNTQGYDAVHGLNIGSADNITLRRITALGSSGYNSSVISLSGTTNSLLEDCAASGQGRNVLNILDSDNITVRRCWLSWEGPDTGGGDTPNTVQVYDSSNVLMENNISVNYSQESVGHIGTWAHYTSISGNSFYGNIGYNNNSTVAGGIFEDAAECGNTVSGTIFSNNVAILLGSGGQAAMEINAAPDNGSVFTNNTFVSPNASGGGLELSYRTSCPGQPASVANASGNSFLTTWTALSGNSSAVNNNIYAHDYNNFYDMYGGYGPLYQTANITPPNLNSHEIQANPNYNTSVYGYGAYLMVPAALKGGGENGTSIGAEILYEYENGILTGIPLWPWPMEERIVDEFGASPTWEVNGGLWNTLNGVYPENIYAIPPGPPQNTVNTAFAVWAGGWQHIDPSGIVYQADTDFSGGSVYSTSATISGTSDSTLYQSELYGDFSYNIPLPNGNYTVTLKFAETYWTTAGHRIFNVSMQGMPVISNLDICAMAGANTAYDVPVAVTVTNGTLNIDFQSVPGSDYAVVSAIVVTNYYKKKM